MNNLNQDVDGNKNRVLSINPENNNPNKNKMTTNIYNQHDEAIAIYRERVRQTISIIAVSIAIILLVCAIIILIKLSYIDNSIENILYKLEFTQNEIIKLASTIYFMV